LLIRCCRSRSPAIGEVVEDHGAALNRGESGHTGACPEWELWEHRVDVLLLVGLTFLGLLLPLPA